ncbi:sigma-70 family rna polymerase sigma factor : RNA polymerase sigma factor, sigma-70 family OS=Singulisphaera acidiphila (strain ATCC BAA-1392 / DSM 18658 / VKM B-2454 / MOB10) GN=Sinac_7487 PE=4 SV=1: Sigma70_r2: Sigma70_r4_2 [Gemmata massiliana]|uniref:ECF RNA polymerase sigma factor SigE n=1 Tax=Gemmata massiliana TaxID=1210884 RepID=A0A6P2D2Q0_9BACT|nr:sigma-70 family RNA polymerase sigma factor [Gemmata massiliana]VTR95127.1 sigma-70 family rna polymerase sigma factor : RNA polymerase sigma factor, sigma-70 family OS=Singulisphaera acidiphila (strain ATCC BAA-1392 / DSM 18658 / VKM B-2454 / MOB10) GN=Sinac_7487 PE=4 SV=1: Sigma70_r2: Sigma70_r4_2 [Gemmata massiliana]
MPVSTVRVLRVIADEEQTDAELLGRFVDRHDEDAFALLVRRHGAMVYGVCRRILPEPDAEDAFQATFLVLAQKARTAAPREVANWLYGVARRAALLAHRSIVRRKERTGDMPDRPAESDPLSELRAALDEELRRLPDAYRTVIVLCDLESRTRKEAALILGWPEGTVAGRLSRAREMLAKRLTKRGVTLPAGAVVLLVSRNATTAGVPGVLVTSTIEAVGSLGASGISPTVATLTEGILKTMLLKKIAAAATVVLVLIATTIGGSVAVGRADDKPRPTAGQEGADKKPVFTAPAKAPVPKAKPKEDKEIFQGAWSIVEASASGKHQAIEISKEQVWVFTGDRLVIYYDDKSRVEMSYEIDPKQKPKAIDLSPVGEREKGYVFKGIYELDGDRLKVYYSRNIAPDAKRPERFDPVSEDRGMRSFVLKRAPEKDALTAWGKEVGGLQAGLEVKEGQRTYHLGETVTILVRVRNTGKETVKFEYIRQYLDENPPGVTGADGKAIPQATVAAMGVVHAPVKVSLEPGKEVVLETRIHGASGVPYDLRSDGGAPMTKNHPLKVGTGKVSLQYERVLGSSSIGALKIDPAIAGLSTGKLELDVSDADQKDAINLPTHDGMRQLKGKDAAAYQTTNAWLAERLKEADSIKVGSTHADVTKHFRTDGGLAQIGKHRFVMILCPYIKIDVEFEKGGAPAPTAKVTKVSRPYFEPEFLD